MRKPDRTVLVINRTCGKAEAYEHLLHGGEDCSYRIIGESDGGQVLTLCQSLAIDGILLESHLPEGDCLELLRCYQTQLGSACPPVVMIGGADVNLAVKALKAGAADYLVEEQLTSEALRLSLRTAIENSELKRQLQQSQERFQTSIENMMDCFGIYTAVRDESGQIIDFRIDYVNAAACANNQMTREQQIGQRLCEVLPGHRDSGLFATYCHLVETGEPVIKDSIMYDDTYGGEKRLLRAFDIRATKLNDGFVASWRDVTDRKQTELHLSQTTHRLQQEQHRLQQLIDNAPIGIGIGLTNGEVKAANEAMLALHGYKRADFEQHGLNWRDFVPPEYADQTDQAMAQLQQMGCLPAAEKELLLADGSRVPIWISAMQWEGRADEHVAFAVDLTQQKQTEAALRDSQRHYQELAEAMPLMVWTADPSGAVNYWNRYWYEYTGLGEAESLGMAGIDRVHPDDRDLTLADWEHAIARGQAFEIEHRIRRWDDTYRWFINRAVPTRNDQGHITGWIGTITEIDQQKRLTERWRLATKAINGLVYDWDIETDEIYRSEKLFDLCGFRPEEVPTDFAWWLEQVHPDDRGWMQQRAQDLFESDDELFESEYRVRHRHGYWVDVWDRGLLVRNKHGHVTRVIGSTVDVSEQRAALRDRQQSQIVLQQSQERLNLAMNAAQMGSWDWHFPTGEVRWSPNLELLFGMSAGGFDGRIETALAMIHPGDSPRVQQAIQQAIEDRTDYRMEFRFIKPDGTVRWALGLGRILYDDTGMPIGMTGVDMDISERKQVELEARSTYIQLEAALAAGAIYTWRWHIPENRVVTNRSFAYLFGVDPDGVAAGLPIEQFLHAIHPDDRPQVEAEIERAIATRTDYASEFRIINADGEERWVIARGRVEYDTEGRAVAFPGALADITERKRAEMLLADNEARLQGFVDSNVIGIYRANIDGSISEANDEFLKMVAYSRADLQAGQLNWSELTPSEYVLLDQAKIAEARRDGACSPYEKEYLRKDGERVTVLIGYSIVGESQKEAIVFVLDLTDRKRTEKRLRVSEDRLRMALESADLGTWDWNLKTGKLSWDTRCKAILGLPPDTSESLETFFATLHPDDNERTRRGMTVSLDPDGDGNFDIEYRIVRLQDQAIRWIAARGQAYFHSDDTPDRFVGTIQDITERKEAEAYTAKLLQREYEARAEAERANRIKDEFLAILSHELRSPLNPILGWANLLQTRQFNAETTARALSTIERNAKLQTQLIDDLLDIARILRGKLKLEMAPVDARFVVEAAIETVQSAADAKEITLEADLPTIGQIRGDAGRLQQIVWNLLTNAIKFTPEKRRVAVRLAAVQGHAQIIVTDTGIGIHPDFLPHVFESFRQKDTSVSRKFGGLGLGLAIVRYLVEAHGGTIEANSAGEGQGATFTVSLPLIPKASHQPAANHAMKEEIDLTGICIMAIDDNADSLELLSAFLGQYGAEVESFLSADAALAAVPEVVPDVLISDIGMPNMDGYELLQQVRSLPADTGGQVPAIAMTAYAHEDDRQRALDSGFQRHIAKPIEADTLALTVVELVNGDADAAT